MLLPSSVRVGACDPRMMLRAKRKFFGSAFVVGVENVVTLGPNTTTPFYGTRKQIGNEHGKEFYNE